MRHGDTGAFQRAFQRILERVRPDIARAVQAWRAQGKEDGELALMVGGPNPDAPVVSTSSRAQLAQTITDFEPTMAIEFAKHVPGQAPAVLELPDYVRRVVWVELPPR
ncbi:MAG: hypothetical protein ACRENE_19690 [Polyangiaceae bacterium]